MGQYHTLVCPTAGMSLDGGHMCGGIKARELIWSQSMPAALAFMAASGLGKHPRDLPWAPTGKWAGLEPLMIGDYAKNGDLTGRDEILPAPEDDLYQNSGARPGTLCDKPRTAKKTRDLSDSLLPILERVFKIRYVDLDAEGSSVGGWRTEVGVYKTDTHPSGWDIDLQGMSEVDAESHIEFYQRNGILDEAHWRRAPLPLRLCGSFTLDGPDHVPDLKQAGQGSELFWVNLDREEVIYPKAIGDTPDLVGIMTGMSAKAALTTLFHHEARGGGDVAPVGPLDLAGRWRGDRIVLMGPAGYKPRRGKKLTQDWVKQEFHDITGLARTFVESEELFGTEDLRLIDQPTVETAPSRIDAEILREAVGVSTIRELLTKGGAAALADVVIQITPNMRLTSRTDGTPLVPAIEVAGSVSILLRGGASRVWIPTAAEKAFRALLGKVAPTAVNVRVGKIDGTACVDGSLVREIHMSEISNHVMIECLAA